MRKSKAICSKCGHILVCPTCKKTKGVKVARSKTTRTATGNYSRTVKGKRPDVHPTYSFKSRTEANFARILNYLGAKWTYEERVFTFDGYKRKPHVYVMDYTVESIKKNDYVPSDCFVEVKGYMNGQSREKLRRYIKHYPAEAARTIIVLYDKYKKDDINFCSKLGLRYIFYDELTKAFSKLIPKWE